jgi:hypothetical protein
MLKRLYPFLILFVSFAACKKSNPIYTAMSATVGVHSTWTTTNVTSEYLSPMFVTITCTSADGNKLMVLNLNNYRDGAAIYPLHNSGTGINANESSATYEDGINIESFNYGQIVITSYSATLIQGTFDLRGTGPTVSGTFTAPTPIPY